MSAPTHTVIVDRPAPTDEAGATGTTLDAGLVPVRALTMPPASTGRPPQAFLVRADAR